MTVVALNEQAGRRSADLADRIAAVLKGDGVSSVEMSSLIAEAEQAAAAAATLAGATRENSLDPRLTVAEAKRARETAFEAEWQSERLTTALAGLREKLVEVRANEADAQRRVDYDKAAAERDRIAAELREFYPAAERRLAQLIAQLDANDHELTRINTQAMPRNGERLKSAELIARGLDGWKIGVNEVTRITADLVWVRFEANPHEPYVWPVKRRY
jgi:hypothetical protein